MEIEFNQADVNSQLNLDLDEQLLLDNSEPDFEDGTLDLGILYDLPEEVQADEVVNLTDEQAIEAIIDTLSDNPTIVTSLSKSINASNLRMISDEVGVDVSELYKTSDKINMLINAIAQGVIVGEGFTKTVPNTIKIFFVTSKLRDSVHLRNIGGVGMYKATPAITDFTEDSVNTLGSVYKTHKGEYKSIYAFIKASCYSPVSVKSDNEFPILDFDDITIAKSLAKSSKGLNAGLSKLKASGCPPQRISKISILAKALIDKK